MKDGDVAQGGNTTRRWLILGGVAAACAGGLAWQTLRPAPDHGGARLSVNAAHDAALAGDVVLIDIRTPGEWRLTGVPDGAFPIDMRRKDFLAALQKVAGSDVNAPIALICARGVRSARLGRALSDAGFGNIVDVPEGMLGSAAGPGWLAQGLPVVAWTGEQG